MADCVDYKELCMKMISTLEDVIYILQSEVEDAQNLLGIRTEHTFTDAEIEQIFKVLEDRLTAQNIPISWKSKV